MIEIQQQGQSLQQLLKILTHYPTYASPIDQSFIAIIQIQQDQMSKSIDDYRNIIKILKLQLLKVREENSELSHTLGIATENETSSFSPKIAHYTHSQEQFAKNILAFLNFAHRCELVGLVPQMVFRIADKKRDKKVSASSFGEILKRVKLRMGETEISQLLNLITRGNPNILYQEYLQCLSAFQINSEKYPPKSSRTYVQLCLLKFGKETQSYNDADRLYKEINGKQDLPYLSFENYTTFVKRNLKNLEEFEIVAVFVGLDVNSQCRIERSIFRREIGKVFSVIERGVNFQEEFSALKEPVSDIKEGKESKEPKEVKKIQKQASSSKDIKRKESKREDPKEEEPEFKYQEETGEQAGNKAKKESKKATKAPVKTDVKLAKGDSVKILGEFKKLGIRITDFMDSLLNSEKKTALVRSFTINDFSESIKSFNRDTPKKKILELFRALDTEANGTIDSSQLLKLWIRGKQLTDSEDVLYRLLYRHLRETQFAEPLQKFQVLGVAENEKITQALFTSVFVQLQLSDEEIKHTVATFQLNDLTVKDFSERLKADGKTASAKQFVRLDRKVYDEFKAVLQKINSKRKDGKKNLRKLLRLQTGEKSTEEEYWQTIFTDEWACWEYCLDTAYKLETFWRDHEFGPTKADPAGIRSIVGNESNPPPGLPDESQISWMTYEQILAKQKSKEKVVFMEKQLSPNDVVQGKLGDCWYVSSLSIIANNQDYLKGKPMQQCRKSQEMSVYGVNPLLFKFFIKYGIYVFKYFKKFQPIYVVVDDLFPVETSSNELIFAKSPEAGMQWVAFLEKSYAKLHHSYSNMISGDIAQGLNDLTNALPIKQAIEEGKPQNMDKIRQLNNEQQLMGCSITAPKGAKVEAPVTLDDEKCGLFYSHAYSILEFLDLKTKKEVYNLIRVRNPWGHGQWILDWSDKPKDDNQEYKSLLKNADELKKYYDNKIELAKKNKLPKPIPYRIGQEDGEFLMKFQDFNKIYTNLFTGYNLPNRYQCLTIRERWDEEYPSGICSLQKSTPQQRKQFVKNNHQYILTVKEDDTDVLMYIIQEDGRLYRGEKYPYKELCNGTLILSFNLTDKEKALEEFNIEKSTTKNLKFQLRREVNLWYKFKAGKYAIIPCKMKNDIVESEFQFRFYFDKDVKVEKVKGHNNSFRPLEEAKTKEIDPSSYGTFLDLLDKHSK